jgi:hypothetical protein
MIIINNKEEFEKFYPYSKEHIKKYPKEYPCVCKIEWTDCDLMGDYSQVYITYFPQITDVREAFIKGLEVEWEILK